MAETLRISARKITCDKADCEMYANE
jgi:hypothetical protein